MTKMANSLVEYIALLRQLVSFCKGWVGDRCCDFSIKLYASFVTKILKTNNDIQLHEPFSNPNQHDKKT